MAQLEHVNITVSDIDAMAGLMQRVFGWHVRWRGRTLNDWPALHVGSADSYVAMFEGPDAAPETRERYTTHGAMNHIGIVVDDLGAVEERVRSEGFQPHAHQDYEPGRRFYFMGPDGIEFEVISYQ